MPNFKMEFGVELLGTAAQFSITNTGPPITYNITIPAGVYFFSVDTTAKNDIAQTMNALINAATTQSETWLSSAADGHRIVYIGADIGDGHTLRLLDCDDAQPLALLLGLYGDAYDWDYYQTHDAPATWRHTACQCWYTSGYDHPQRDQYGFPVFGVDHRVAEDGSAVHLTRTKKRLINLTINAIPGTLLRDDTGDAVGAMTDGAMSPSLWRASDPEITNPIVHIYAASRFNSFYYLQKPIEPEDTRRIFDRWSGFYDLDLELAVADV